jgi:catechol 2,3-dioxygenase-like lactoylglutathione lyase family enzyme
MTITFQSSAVFVQDIAASRRFYEELLGQDTEVDHGLSVTFQGGLALWQIDHAFQVIYESTPDNPRPPQGHNYELHFETADAKAAAVRLAEAGVEFVHPVREMPWGKRIFRVRDPDGHIVAVGESMAVVIARLLGQGMSAEAVTKRTAMPLEVVKQTAKGKV